MKLTDDLKNKLDSASSSDEKQKIVAETKKNVEDAGVILEDDELDEAAGGGVFIRGNRPGDFF